MDVLLRGRLLARYAGDQQTAALPEPDAEREMITRAIETLLRDRLIDAPHLGELEFKVQRS